ncbi:MAG TPA: glycine cleavage system protein GcvH [Clostridiaceae bacterium]|nr:glycine cleavage system protein GcvH [Clostridiaceae bacterium]
MKTFKGLRYSKEHEWVRVEGNKAYIGISNYAQLSLGDIVYVELPEVGAKFNAMDIIGVVESVKTASDIYSPVSGTVIEVNQELVDNPEKINEEPYESWIALLELDNPAEIDELMDEDEYAKFCMAEG